MQFIGKQVRLVLRDLRKSFASEAFLTFGGFWTLLEASIYFFDISANKSAWGASFLVISLAWAFYKTLPRTRVSFTIANSDTKVTIYFGDLFESDDIKVIPVNEFFDSEMGDHVSDRSLHGLFILNFLAGKSSTFDQMISEGLTYLKKKPAESIKRETGKTKRYEIGTTIPVVVEESKFLLVALAQTDIETKKAYADLECLLRALGGLWKQARISSNGHKISVPLVGSGLAGVGLPVQQLLQILIISIIRETQKQKITSEIDIVLHERLFDEISLRSIMGGKY